MYMHRIPHVHWAHQVPTPPQGPSVTLRCRCCAPLDDQAMHHMDVWQGQGNKAAEELTHPQL